MKRKLEDVKVPTTLNAGAFSDRLKHMRKRHQITQADLGEFFGISRAAYTAMENGKHFMSVPYLAMLQQFYAEKYGDFKSLEWWCFGKEPGVRISDIEKELQGCKRENELMKKIIESQQRTINLIDSQEKKESGV